MSSTKDHCRGGLCQASWRMGGCECACEQCSEAMRDKPEIVKVRLEDLQPGPIRHQSLLPEVLEKVDIIFQCIGQWVGNREAFEVNLMRDMNPEQEVNVWLRIAAAWQKYHFVYLGAKVQTDDEENRRVGALIIISFGVEFSDMKDMASKEEYDRLFECYKNPMPLE
jgi:hypothetical protein